MSLADLAFKVVFAAIILYIRRSQVPTDFGSNLTQVPIRNDGILPAFACLKIVILETVNILASSSAVKARSIRSIRSANDKGSAVLFSDFHSISLLNWIYCAATAAYYFWTRALGPTDTCPDPWNPRAVYEFASLPA